MWLVGGEGCASVVVGKEEWIILLITLLVFLKLLFDENVKFNVNTVGDTGACHTNRG